MNKNILYVGLFLVVCIFSSCEKCIPTILCPYQNPQFYSVQGGDTAALYFPNAFTPNGDGVDDYFELFRQNIASLQCQIYDASGRMIFQSNSLYFQWDGTVNGKPSDVGIYAVRVNATTIYGKSFQLLGTVSLIDGQFFGGDMRNIVGNMYLEIKNAQFPNQGYKGVFDPNLPNIEHFLTLQVNNCR